MTRQSVASANPNNSSAAKVGIIAGRGELPILLAEKLRASDKAFHLLLVQGEALPSEYSAFEYDVIPITKVGKFFKSLHAHKCTQVTMVGPVSRPNFKNIFPDKEGFKLLGRISAALSKGDDGLLSAITNFIEDNGFDVVGAHEFDDTLISDIGTLGKIAPSDEQRGDIQYGIEVSKTLSTFDIGQALVVRAGYVLAIEAAEGTNNMIERCADFRWEEGAAGVLVKMAKAGQELRVDMPAIGVETVKQVAKAGLSGIAIEAGKTLLIDREAIIAEADKQNIFIEVFSVTA
jgi:DUF1009 family protein